MHQFWDSHIRPVLECLRPVSIAEIGCAQGRSTRHLLDFCRQNGGTLHAIDPVEGFNVTAAQEEFADCFVFHQDLSLNVISGLDRMDVVLIDGDHNWYTVYNELSLVERHATEGRQPFPFIFLHDVGWPYGRRDLYYAPETIPAAFRHDCARLGIVPGRNELHESAGINRDLVNARFEGTAQNGVLTAVEGFMAQSSSELRFLMVPGFFGLGMLFGPWHEQQSRSLAKFLDEWNLPERVLDYLTTLEKARISDVMSAFKRMSSPES